MVAKAKSFHFIKMQGTGNDCIIFDNLRLKTSNLGRFAKKICHRTLGVGADQLLILGKSRHADFKMEIFNADGSQAEMCGNGIRCLARYIKEAKYTQKKEMTIETLAGIRKLKVTSKTVFVDLGEPKLKGKEIPVNLSGRIINRPLKIENKDFRITCISMGNPHCVLFQENLDNIDIDRFGPLLENYHLFPKRTNVSFANVTTPQEIRVRVWERGAGETLSCGTAAAATLVASVLNGFTDRKAKIVLPGGKLEVEWQREGNHVWLAGPAEKICEGDIRL